MKLAIDTFSYYMNFGKHGYVPRKPVDIRWYCQLSKELGADGLHIDPYHIDLEKDTGWVRDFAIENNMYVELGASGTTIEELRPYILAADAVGAKLLRTFVGGTCLSGRAITRERAKKARKQLAEVMSIAAEYGIKIAIENHGDIFIEDMLAILEIKSDSLGVCFDSGNFAFTGEDPLDGLDAFGDRILCTHLKDVCDASVFPDAEPFKTVKAPVHFCALGDGYLPMGKILGKLKHLGINQLTIEICSPCDTSMNESDLLQFEVMNVKKSIVYIKQP